MFSLTITGPQETQNTTFVQPDIFATGATRAVCASEIDPAERLSLRYMELSEKDRRNTFSEYIFMNIF
jgi:hypothetical protein